MHNNEYDFFQDIYSCYLKNINGVKFTRREIDIIAFLISGRSAKKIGSFLSLSPKTVANYTHNIMVKLGCNSRQGIIDFIEKSGQFLLVKKYYSTLLSDAEFEKFLKNISVLKAEETPVCKIVYLQAYLPQNSLVHHLEAHFKLAGIIVSLQACENKRAFYQLIQEPCNGIYVIYIVPPILLEGPQAESNAENTKFSQEITYTLTAKLFLVFPGKNPPGEFPKDLIGADYIELGAEKNYYYLVFEIFKRILPQSRFETIISEFYKINTELHNFFLPLSFQLLPQRKTLEDHEDQVASKTALFLKNTKRRLLLALTSLSLLGLVFLTFKWSYKGEIRKPHEQLPFQENLVKPSARSDLIIPTESVLLNRVELLNLIEDKLKAQPEGIQTIALVGIGGSGKTTVARDYARSQNLSVIWEINAETTDSLRGSFENLVYALSKTDEEKKKLRELKDIKNLEERSEKVMELVKNHLRAYSDWLLIYDNMEKFSDVQKYFPSDPAMWGKGKVILTTRNGHVQHNMHIGYAIVLEALSQIQQVDLFMKIMNQGVNRPLTLSEKKAVHNFLDNIPPFPLDISIAAYYLKATNVSYEKYIEILKKSDIHSERLTRKIMEEFGVY
jgi:DNA-binding CsgD family transcriptional regulator